MTTESTIIRCPSCGQQNRIPLARRQQGPRCGKCKLPLPAGGAGGGRPVDVDDGSFAHAVLGARGTVLVDCWAPWCGPCRMVAPVLEALAREYAGRLTVAKLNTEDNPRTATELGIQSIPTLLLYRGGRLVDRLVGAAPRPQLEGWLRSHGVA